MTKMTVTDPCTKIKLAGTEIKFVGTEITQKLILIQCIRTRLHGPHPLGT
jgi:hypothetical protein